ncbi:MAG: leucine--tRNA ligase [Fimbriimonas ginsengisoli]|uniref:Leucine--tRNA ligase n=1 Tax=Fimbriimonas ginsengisoli TaxID=1005039 RepID=A0A931PTT4_FIMGI|nr:leucine--tRNA ligase [Fimbriimonas ginsengisoli]
MADRYDPAAFEAKWPAAWQEADLFKTTEDPKKPKFYGMDFFPYPSGAGLSVGHCRNYIPTDVVCRMKRMQGYNVLHPMGFDAFGLPAENEAIKNKTHPAPMIERYAATYRRQMELIGISYDWSRSFASSEPTYYRWTQWIFEVLHRRGLAHRKPATVNWDPVDKTVLADEEVIAGRAERSGALVERRTIPQWFFKITDYAQRLIDDLDTVDWPEGIKAQQRNWIGRSEGVQFSAKVAPLGSGETPASGEFQVLPKERELAFEVFTTRIDTIFGVTFWVLAPEHPLVEKLRRIVGEPHAGEITAYCEAAKRLSDQDRQAVGRDKTGVFTGAHGINPVNGEKTPIWVADYVMATYGTGAIMAVPGGDARDHEFATKFSIPIRQVISPDGSPCGLPFDDKCGVLVNSGSYSGMPVPQAIEALGQWVETRGIGERKVQYKLRDWLISRQRYWGCPIPIIHGADGHDHLVPEDQLPVQLPIVDHYEPSGDGSSPLAGIPEFVNVTDPDGRLGKRETDTMGGFACSSWYFLRFCDPDNHEKAWSPEKVAYWMPVDCYVGGAEHAVMHLLYARFWTKVLFDEGLVPVKEPFQCLRNQGQVLANTPFRKPAPGEKLDVGEEGILISFEEAAELPKDQVVWRWVRMSKSKGNVVTPDEAVAVYGADALRIYELFVAPFEQDVRWSNEGMQGASRYLSRVFKLASELKELYDPQWRTLLDLEELDEPARAVRRLTHQTIRKATEDIERFAFNTYVSALMIYVNELGDRVRADQPSRALGLAASEALESLILLLSPAAPHSGDELWHAIGKEGFTYTAPWPKWNADLAKDDIVTIAVQVNGKLRDTLHVPAGIGQPELEAAALASPKVQPHIDGKSVRRVIVVPNKLVNVVLG